MNLPFYSPNKRTMMILEFLKMGVTPDANLIMVLLTSLSKSTSFNAINKMESMLPKSNESMLQGKLRIVISGVKQFFLNIYNSIVTTYKNKNDI